MQHKRSRLVVETQKEVLDMHIRIRSILPESLADGPGLRTVVFMQGCDKRCPGCHNPESWDMTGGTLHSVEELVEKIVAVAETRRVTISGGEPLLQLAAVLELARSLKDSGFDLCLYTGREESEVPREIYTVFDAVKTGPYDEKKRTSVMPYIGSTNQKFTMRTNA